MVYFPEQAFRPQTVKEKLSHIFTARAYGRDDVLGIRTALHYTNMTTDGAYAHCDLACAIASKMADGNFAVTRHTGHISQHVAKRFGGTLSIDGSGPPPVICKPDEVLDVLGKIDAEMAKAAVYSTMMPETPIARIADTVPLPVAREIFDHPCAREEIEHRIDMLHWYPMMQRVVSSLTPSG